MEKLLIAYACYSIFASASLIWSSLLAKSRDVQSNSSRPTVAYVPIPDYLVSEWTACYQNLILFDLHADHGINDCDECAPYRLTITTGDLPDLLRWLPSASRIVFCCRHATENFDNRIETAFLQLGIETIYFLDESPIVQAHQVGARGDISEGKRKLDRW